MTLVEGGRVFGPAMKHQVKFSDELYLFNLSITQDDPRSVGGGGPSVVHEISTARHV